jgi:hypothetical protein
MAPARTQSRQPSSRGSQQATYRPQDSRMTGLRLPSRSDRVPMKKAPMAKAASSREVWAVAVAAPSHGPGSGRARPTIRRRRTGCRKYPRLTKKPGQVSAVAGHLHRPSYQWPSWAGWAALPSSSRRLGRPTGPGCRAPATRPARPGTGRAGPPPRRHLAPAGIGQYPGQGRGGQHGAEVAEQDGEAGQGAELAVAEPGRVQFEQAMKVTETPRPTSRRPSGGQLEAVGQAEQHEPRPATTPPATTMRRGPRVSARTPVGICITV